MGTMDPKDKANDQEDKSAGANQPADSMATGITPTSTASVTTGLQQHPPPSPLSGCYLLIVLPEPHTAQHKELILNRLAKGFLSWDKDSCHVDLEKELHALVAQSPEGEEARNGERLIQYATENLVTEILIHPQTNTLLQCMRNLLASFTKHRHIIHAGYTFQENGSWVLQDGTFSLADFVDALSEHDVQRVLRAYENTVTVDINCAGIGEWSTNRLTKEPCTRACRVRLNPDDVLTSGIPAITNFINYIEQYLVAQTLDQLMQPSDVVGNIRFSHPTLYVFPGGQGDAALFGINGFNMLVDGGFARKSCFWDFTRHLDRLDAVLFTRLNNSNVGGMTSVLRKKKEMHVYPQIGHFFCNLIERKHSNSPDGDKDLDPLIISLTDLGQEMMVNLKHINLRPHPCYRDNEPINLYHKVGHGTLDMYVLSPSKDSREVREFLAKWNASDLKLFSGSQKKDLNNLVFPIQNMVSICALLVWQPANPEDTITRILFPGSTPQHKIFEGVDRLKHLEFLKHPTCTSKSISPTASLITLKEKSTKLKISQTDKETKRADVKKPSRDEADVKSAKTQPVKIKKTSALENKKIDEIKDYPKTIIETKESKKVDKEIKKEVKKEVIKDKEPETKKAEVKPKENKMVVSEPKIKMKKKEKEVKDVKEAKAAPKMKKIEVKVEDKKAKAPIPKKPEVSKAPIPKASSKPATKPSLPPPKSAKEANNRKVLEQKNKEKMSAKPKPTPPPPPTTAEKKPVVRRPKPISSPSKARLTGSPIKSVKSTPTSSIKSEKDDIVRKIKAEKGTADSSTVSTPSAIEVDSTKFIDKCLTERSEDMSLDSIESKVLADLKEERQVVEEIEAVLQKAERINDARKVQLEEEDETVDKKEEDMTEDDVTAEIDEIPRKSTSRKPSQELTEDDEYLIIEKEEPYTEDSVHSGEAEHKHFLDTVQSEKVQKLPVEEKEKDETVDAKKALAEEEEEEEEVEGEIEEEDEEEEEGDGEEEEEHEDEYDEREDIEEVEEEEEEESEEKEVAVEKGIIEEQEKVDVPEKKLQEVIEDDKKVEAKDQVAIAEYKEQLDEEVKEIITSATEIVQKVDDKDDSGKKDSEDVTKEGLSLSPEKLDSSEKKTTDTDIKPEVEKEHVQEKLEESQERISTIESGATTTAPTLPEDERIPVEAIKPIPIEGIKPLISEEVKKIEKVVEPKVMPLPPAEISETKPTAKPFTVRQTILPRDIVKTPDEVADLPVHEEVDPNLYKVDDFEKDKEGKVAEPKEPPPPPPAAKEQKGVFGFFGKVADKLEKGIDKLARKARRDSEKDIDEKSSKSISPKSKSGSPKESVEQLAAELKEKIPEKDVEMKKPLDKPTELPIDNKIKVETDIKEEEVKKIDEKPQMPKAGEISEDDVGEVEALLEEASKKFKTVKDSLRDSLESLEDQMAEEELKLAKIVAEDEIKEKLHEVVEKLEEMKPQLEEEPIDKEPEKVKFIIPKDEEGEEEDEDDKNVFDHMEITKNVKEAVKDVGEVLAGTAGIRIDEKPKDVIEIVKKVAEVLKEDDFLSEKVLFKEEVDAKVPETKEEQKASAPEKKDSPKETVVEEKLSATEASPEEKAAEKKETVPEMIPSRKESLLEAVVDQIEPVVSSIAEKIDAEVKEAVEKIPSAIKETLTAAVPDDKDAKPSIPEKTESITELSLDKQKSPEQKEPIVEAILKKESPKVELKETPEDKKSVEEDIKESISSRKESLVEVTSDKKPSVGVLDLKDLAAEVIADKKESPVICHEEPCVKTVIDKGPVTTPKKDADEADAKAICAELMKDDLSPISRKKRSLGDIDDGKKDVLEAGIEEVCTKIDVHKDDKTIDEDIVTSEITFDHKTSPAVAEVVMVTPDSMPPSPKFPVHIPQEKETADKEESDDLSKIKVDVPKNIEDIVNKNENIYKIIEEIILIKKIKITVEILEFIIITKRIPRRELVHIIDQIIVEKKLAPETVVDDVDLLSTDQDEKEEEEEEVDEEEIDESKKIDVEDYIHKNYIEKNIKITWPILEELAAKKTLPVRMMIEIIEEIIIIKKIPRSKLLDISEENLNKIIHEEKEKMDKSIIDKEDEKVKLQLENELNDEFIVKGKKINADVIENLSKNQRVSRRIIIEIIEEIIIKKKLQKSSVVDVPLDVWNALKAEDEPDEEEEEGKSVEEDKLVEGFIDVPSKDSLMKMQLEEQEKDAGKGEIDDFEAVEQEYKLDSSQVEEAIEDDMHDVVEADEKMTDVIKVQKSETISKVVSEDKKLKPDEKDEVSTVKRMVVTATSEDGGEETEICPTGSITFSKTITPDDSLKGSPVKTTPDKDSLISPISSPEKDSISDKTKAKDGKVTPDSLEKSLDGKVIVEEAKSVSVLPTVEDKKELDEAKELKEEKTAEVQDKKEELPVKVETKVDEAHKEDVKVPSPQAEKQEKISPIEKEDVKDKADEKAEESPDDKTSISPMPSSPSRKESLVSAKIDEAIEKIDQLTTESVKESDAKAPAVSLPVSMEEKSLEKVATDVKEMKKDEKEEKIEDIKTAMSPVETSLTRKESSVIEKEDKDEKAGESIDTEKGDEKHPTTLPIRKESLIKETDDKKDGSVVDKDEKADSDKSSISPAPLSPIRKDSVITDKADEKGSPGKGDKLSTSPKDTTPDDKKGSTAHEDEKAESIKSSSPAAMSPSRKESLAIDKVDEKADSIKSSTSPAPSSPTRKESLIIEKVDEKADGVKSSTSPAPTSPVRKESSVIDKDEKVDSVKSSSPAALSPVRKESLITEKADDKAESVKSSASPVSTSPTKKEGSVVDKDESVKSSISPISLSPTRRESLVTEKADSVKSATSPAPSSPTREESLIIEKVDEKADSVKSSTSPAPTSPVKKESPVLDKDEKAESIKSTTSPAPSSPTRKESLAIDKGDEKAESIKSSTSPVALSPTRKESLTLDQASEKADSIKSSTSPAPTSPIRKESLIPEKADEKAESVKSSTSPAPLSPIRKESLVADKKEKAESIKSTSPAPSSPTRKESLAIDKIDEKADSIKSSTSPAPTSPIRKESLIPEKADEKAESVKSSTSPAPLSPIRKESLVADKKEKAESIKSTSPAPSSPTRKESLAIDKIDEKADSIKSSTSPAPTSPIRKESLIPEKADEKAESVKSSTSPAPTSPVREESSAVDKDEKAESIKSGSPAALSPVKKESLITDKADEKIESIKTSASPASVSPTRKESLVTDKADSVQLSTSPASISPVGKESSIVDEKADSVKSSTSPAVLSPVRKESSVVDKDEKAESIKSTSPAPTSPIRKESLAVDEKADSVKSSTSPAPTSPIRKESLIVDEKADSIKSSISPAPTSPVRKESLIVDEKADSIKSATSPAPSSPTRKESLAIDKADEKADSIKSSTSPAPTSPIRKESLVADKEEKAESIKSTTSPTLLSPTREDSLAASKLEEPVKSPGEVEKVVPTKPPATATSPEMTLPIRKESTPDLKEVTAEVKSVTADAPLSARKESLVTDKEDKAESIQSSILPTAITPSDPDTVGQLDEIKSTKSPSSIPSPSRKESLIVDKEDKADSIKFISPIDVSPDHKKRPEEDAKAESVKSSVSPSATTPSRKESLVTSQEVTTESLKTSTSPTAVIPGPKEGHVDHKEATESTTISSLPALSSRKESLVIEKDDNVKSSTSPDTSLSPKEVVDEKDDKFEDAKSSISPVSTSRKDSLVIEKKDKAESVKSSISPAPSSPERKESLTIEKAESVKSTTSPAPMSPTRKESLAIDKADEKADSIKSSTSPAPTSPVGKESSVIDKDEKAEGIKSTSPAPSSPIRKESLAVDEKADSVKSSTSPAPTSPIRKESLIVDEKADSIKSSTSPAPTSPVRKESLIVDKDEKAESIKSTTSPTPSSPTRKESLAVEEKADSIKSSTSPAPTSPIRKESLIPEKADEKAESVKSSTSPAPLSPIRKESLVADKEEKAESIKSTTSPAPSSPTRKESLAIDKGDEKAESIKSSTSPVALSPTRKESLVTDKADSIKSSTSPAPSSPMRKDSLVIEKVEDKADSVKSSSPAALSPIRKESLVTDKADEKAESIKSSTSPAPSSPTRKESLVADKADSVKSATSPAPLSPVKKESPVLDKDEKAESIKSTTSPALSSPTRKESLTLDKASEKADSVKSSTSPAPTSPIRKDSLIADKEEKAESIKSTTSPAPLSPIRKQSLIIEKAGEKAESMKPSASPITTSPTRIESLSTDKDEKAESVKSSVSPAPSSTIRKESLTIEKLEEKADSVKSSTSPAPLSPTRKESIITDKAESVKSSTSPAPTSPVRKDSLTIEKLDEKADSIKSSSPAALSPVRKANLAADKADEKAESIKSSTSPTPMSPTRKESSVSQIELPSSTTKDVQLKSPESTPSPKPSSPKDTSAPTDKEIKPEAPKDTSPGPKSPVQKKEDSPIEDKDKSPAEKSIDSKGAEVTDHHDVKSPALPTTSPSSTSETDVRKESFSKSLEKSKDMASTESLVGSKREDSLDEDEDLGPIKEIPPKDRSRSQSLYETGEKTPLGRSRSASLYEEKDELATMKQDIHDIQEHLAKYEVDHELKGVQLTKLKADIEEYIIDRLERIKITNVNLFEDIVIFFQIPKHIALEIIEEICKERHIDINQVLYQSEEEELKSSHAESKDNLLANLSSVKRVNIENHITEHYIKPKAKMTSEMIEMLAKSEGVQSDIIYAIIECLITERKLAREALIEEDKEEDDGQHEVDEPVLISEKKRMEVESYVVDKYLNRRVMITSHDLNEMMKVTSVPRYILLEIIEEIIKRMKLPRSSIYDEEIYSEIEYKERTLGHMSGKSTPDGKSSGYSTPEVRSYDAKHESQFHKAFLDGITEIRTTHITTLSGKSTPDIGAGSDSSQDLKAEVKSTIIQEQSEPIIIKHTIVREVEEEEEESSGPSTTSVKQVIVKEGSPEYETVIKTTVVKREIIEEDDQPKEDVKHDTKEIKDKIPTHKEHLEMLMSGEKSGRSTPDKKEGSEGRSSTATPEGFRSGEVIKTTITTTRTMSHDGEIITTTKEVTETTNERGETVVLEEKMDVKVADRGPLTSESTLEPTKSSESLKTHGPSDDEPLNIDDEAVGFSAEDMSSSFYGQLPSVPPTRSDVPSLSGASDDFTFKKASSEKFADMGDYDVDRVLRDYQPPKKDDDSHSDAGSTSSKDPIKDWGTPMKLPPPERPDRFNLRTGALIHTVDISPDSLDFDIIHDWGEPMRLPSPAPVIDESNKVVPSTPKKEVRQPKKVISENVKNKKRSESPGKTDKKSKDSKKKIQPVYVDLTYVPHHGNSYYASLEFFKRVRARYYVFSGTEPSRDVYDALLNAKKTWENKDLEVTMIPTYDTDTLGYWVADNEEALAINRIDLSPSASRCTINLQDHETSCSAYRLEF
ncbi:microtubule-associated protein futsch [Chelonus insularis]|uniref:microtubule-associated protein futsch n=1 Tax=Chelonus insularis TaxID=460826 RepID=UPI00158E8004|nr:microtubule-associated protein futsch [Chelonus insularis]XP_034933817.1 microtubule-associated protein futsch [Chelonus insularis]XP_034933818.1 microtubule-associated protein futsch [Chelonus insularis]XP_034933819.1 microtubule-associated protein futsch [Chelonus insularis]